MKYITEGNALKRRADKKTEQLETLVRTKIELIWSVIYWIK